ncbi:MAG: hypothetical protein ABR538_13610 [Candidatus Binatia bacterium]
MPSIQRSCFLVAAALAVLARVPLAEAQHDGDIAIVASGNTLHALGEFETPIVVQQGFCAGGLCLYSATNPGLVSPSEAPSPFSSIDSGTALRLEIVEIDSGASVKIGTTVLDAAGESASLGTTPSVHVHPSWQLTAAMDALQQRVVSFRITSSPTNSYLPSATHSIMISTFEPATTTSTTSSTSTTTETSTTSTSLTLPAYCGDGQPDETDGEQCDHGDGNGSKGSACRADCTWTGCGDIDHSGSITAGDALHVLRVAVGTASCDTCVCDTRVSLASPISATDALHLLKMAVGLPVELQCPPCE